MQDVHDVVNKILGELNFFSINSLHFFVNSPSPHIFLLLAASFMLSIDSSIKIGTLNPIIYFPLFYLYLGITYPNSAIIDIKTINNIIMKIMYFFIFSVFTNFSNIFSIPFTTKYVNGIIIPIMYLP